MIARQCITVSCVKTKLLLSVTIVMNGEQVVSNLLAIKAGLPGAELEIVVCSDKFVGTALVPTKLVGTACGNSACSHKACRNRLVLGIPIENKCVKGGGLMYGGLI